MWQVVQRYNMKFLMDIDDKVVYESSRRWLCVLYRWFHYVCQADPSWRNSFSWDIEEKK